LPFIHKKKIWSLGQNHITDETLFKKRREILKKLAGSSFLFAGSTLSTYSAYGSTDPLYPPPINEIYKVNRELTKESYAITYTNFYEFGSNKNIWRKAARLKTKPWLISIEGLINKPLKIDINDLIKKVGGIEERVYRFRCVEAWSMTVPWAGFPLSKIISLVEPKSDAKFIKFETFYNPDIAPGQKQKWYPWPYVEGITIEEANNDLSFMATGIYGKELPNQNGAPFRLVLPWKYGFKSIKSIVKISFVKERPISMWEKIAPQEYGFWANVNPEVSHPRWSQATEQQLGSDGRIPTVIYNGYAEQVSSLYQNFQDKLKDKLFR